MRINLFTGVLGIRLLFVYLSSFFSSSLCGCLILFGPVSGCSFPFFANRSAVSLPLYPWCSGTQDSVTWFFEQSLFRLLWHPGIVLLFMSLL